MKYRLRKFPLIRLLLLCFILLLSEKLYLTAKIFSMHRTYTNIWWTFWIGSECTYDLGFTKEKFYRMSILIWYGQSRLQNFFIAFLFLELIKKYVSLRLSWRSSLPERNQSSSLICSTNEWTSFNMIGTSAMDELRKKV